MSSETRSSPASSVLDSRISQSSIPAFALASIFFVSAGFPPKLRAHTYTPPFVLRCGFGAIFAGAGYILSTGDSRNGSGIATSWTLSYLIIEQFTRGLNRSQRLPRSRLSILLSAATAATATLYGTEHFILQDDDGPDEPSSQHHY